MTMRLALVALLSTLCASACGHHDGGVASGATCPATQTLTYDNFGKAFMESYCTRCHATTLTGDARQGATADHDFDRIELIRVFSNHIDEMAAAGPASVNTAMPPSGPTPSEADRRKLGEWLACGAP